NALPRAWLAPEVLVVPDEPAARAALADAAVDPRRRVVVEAPFTGRVAPPAAGTATGAESGPPAGSARLLRDEPECVEVAVAAPGEGVLVLADSWMPGWSAELDGQPAAMRPAD